MDKTLQDWVYTAQIERITARFNSAQGADRDNMIDAVRSATLQALRNNDYSRSSDLITAFPNMRHWETAIDRRHKAEIRKYHLFSVLKLMAGALVLGAALYVLKAYGLSLGPLSDARWVYWLTGIAVALNCFSWFFRTEELIEGRKPASPSLEQTIGEWTSISGMAALGLAMLFSLVQVIWLV